MKRGLLLFLLAVCLFLTGCVEVSVSREEPVHLNEDLEITAIGANGRNIDLEMKIDSTDLKVLWPEGDFGPGSRLELGYNLYEEDILFYPLVLNGDEPQTEEGKVWIGILSSDPICLGDSDTRIEARGKCHSNDPSGVTIYLFEIDDDQLEFRPKKEVYSL